MQIACNRPGCSGLRFGPHAPTCDLAAPPRPMTAQREAAYLAVVKALRKLERDASRHVTIDWGKLGPAIKQARAALKKAKNAHDHHFVTDEDGCTWPCVCGAIVAEAAEAEKERG